MSKLNKGLKVVIWVLVGIVILGAIADLICLKVMPNETKQFNDILVEYANRPLPVIGVSLVVVGLFLLKLFASTSFGKSQIALIKEQVATNNENTQELVNTLIQENSALKEQLSAKEHELEIWKEQLIEILKLIPNAKVQNALKEIDYGEQETKETTNN